MNTEMDGIHPYPVSAGPSPEGIARRRTASRIANHTRWAHEGDRAAATAPARAAFDRRFEDEVDPDHSIRVSDPAGFAKRVGNAKSAYFTRLAQKSAETRAAKKSA